MSVRARLERIERRLPRPAEPPAPQRFTWPDGSGPHATLPPVDLRIVKVTPPRDGAPVAGHPGFIYPDGSGPHLGLLRAAVADATPDGSIRD